MMQWFRILCMCVSVWTSAATVVPIDQGTLRGVSLDTRGGRKIHAFLGIPYATPPIGPLRFHKPLPPQPWDGVRDASVPSSPCLQSNQSSRGEVFGSEDCLYLNIFTPKISNESFFPVLVYIHGGDFKEGWNQHYQPEYLMDKDIVFVTINYRLGVLGFLSLEVSEMPGNNGLKDQKMALEWIRDNVAHFGGDKSAVTLSGKGAGAASVHLHMLTSENSGLFHRAISLSGSAYCPWAVHPAGQAQLVGERFASHLGCNHHLTNDTLDCLRAIPAYILVDIAQGMYEWHTDPVVVFGAAIEPKDTDEPFLSKDPWELNSKIPWIAGLTSAEGISKAMSLDSAKIIELNDDFEFLGPFTLLFQATAEDAVHTAFSVKKFYFFDGDMKPDNLENLSNMYSDAWYLYPIKESIRRHKGPKFLYYFDYRGENSLLHNTQGVAHLDDLQYLFPMKYHFTRFNVSEENRKLSENIIELLTNFMMYGKPTIDNSDVVWTESSNASDYLHVNNSSIKMEKDLLQERDHFWSELPYRDKFVPTHKEVKDEL